MKNKKLIILFLMLALLAASALGFAGFSRFDNAWVRGWLNVSGNSVFNGTITSYDLVVAGNVLFNTSVGKEFFFNASNGYVGIGTMSPTYTLHVIGNASISDNLTVDTNTLYVDS